MSGTHDLVIRGATVVTPEVTIAGGAVAVSGGKISYVGVAAGAPPAAAAVELPDGYLLPGFVDLHCHGGAGFDVTVGRYQNETRSFSGAAEDFRAGARAVPRAHLAHGTTGLLLSTFAAEEQVLLLALAAAGQAVGDPETGARVLGVNLEGNYLKAGEFAGAQNPAHFRHPSAEDFDRLNAAALGRIKVVDVAADHGYAAVDLVRHLVKCEVVASCGHTGANYAEMVACIDAGVTLAVHFSNGPSATSFKPPGMATEAMLGDPRVTLELIADGYHVNPKYLLSFLAAKKFRAVLVTDAMAPVAAPEITRFTLAGKTGELAPDGGVFRLSGSATTLFGSVLTMDRAVANVVGWLVEGLPGMYQNAPVIDPKPLKEEALVLVSRLASGYPAEVLGLRDQFGAIEMNLLADLVYLDEDLSARRVWVGGKQPAATAEAKPAAGE